MQHESDHLPEENIQPVTTPSTSNELAFPSRVNPQIEKIDIDGSASSSANSTKQEEPRVDGQCSPQGPSRARFSANKTQKKRRRRYFGLPKETAQQPSVHIDDYEQKYPDDEPGEHLGPNARFYRVYLDEHERFRFEMVGAWKDSLDVLLVFAGLFSAVVTTIVVESSHSLQPDYAQLTTALMVQQSAILSQMLALQKGQVLDDTRAAEPVDLSFFASTNTKWVNGLWFTSLALSLCTALVAVVVKQWLQNYMASPTGAPRKRAQLLHVRYLALEQWRVPTIIGLLPFLLHISLLLFFCGLVIFLMPIHKSMGIAVGIITFSFYLAYLAAAMLPLINPRCPYKTSLSYLAYTLLRQLKTPSSYLAYALRQLILSPLRCLIGAVLKLNPANPWRGIALSLVYPVVEISKLLEAETLMVWENNQLTDAVAEHVNNQMILWMYSFSFSPSATSVTLQVASALSAENRLQAYRALDDIQQEIRQSLPLGIKVARKLDRLSQTLVSLSAGDFSSTETLTNAILEAGIDGLPLQPSTWIGLLGSSTTHCHALIVLHYWHSNYFTLPNWHGDLVESADTPRMCTLPHLLSDLSTSHNNSWGQKSANKDKITVEQVLKTICGSYARWTHGALQSFFVELAKFENEIIEDIHLPIIEYTSIFLVMEHLPNTYDQHLINMLEELVERFCSILRDGSFGDLGSEIYLYLLPQVDPWLYFGHDSTPQFHSFVGRWFLRLTSQNQERMEALIARAKAFTEEFKRAQVADEHADRAEAGRSSLVSAGISSIDMEETTDGPPSRNIMSKLRWPFSKPT